MALTAPANMVGRVSVLLRTCVTTFALAACASGPAATDASLPAPETVRTATVGEGWLAVRSATCKPVGEALVRFASEPGGPKLEAVLARENAGWCAIEPDGAGVRVDGLAQRVATELETTAIAFYVADGRWSCALFDKGFPAYQLESHYQRPPKETGTASTAASLTGTTASTWSGLAAKASTPAAHLELATALGVERPERGSSSIAAAPTDTPTASPSSAVEGAERSDKPGKLVAGSWVVMPPFGIMLLKGTVTKDIRGTATTCYDVAADTQRMAIPVANATALGMRPLATPAKAKAVLSDVRADVAVTDPGAYHEDRARKHLDGLKAGDLDAIVVAFRELCAIRGERQLYAIEDGLWSSTRDWLTEELALALTRDKAAVKQDLTEACGE